MAGHLPTGFYTKSVTLGVSAYVNTPGLQRQIREQYQRISYGEKRVKAANEASAEWLTQTALEYLQQRIRETGRRQEEPRNLERVVGNKELTSTWSTEGFEFFKSSKVNRTNVRRYWRVIEQGSDYWVRRSERTGEGLVFLGELGTGVSGPQRGAGTSQVRLVKPGKTRGRRIRRPIPAYGYLDYARTRFEDNRIYRQKLRDAFKGTPIHID